MKKILLILLAFTSFASFAQAEFPEGLALNGNAASANTSKVIVQEPTTGNLNYINALDLPASTADKLKGFLSTGLIKNGLISANGDPTKFNITAGIGIISNFDDPENPISTIINFPAFNSITPTYLTTGNITYVAINSTPAVVMQATPFTPEQRRSLIVLGATIHSNLTTINVLNNISAPTNADTNQLHDFMEAVGALNITGNKYTANGANLQLNKSAGVLFKLGSNFAVDWKNPHEIAQTGGTAIPFRYRTQNGTESADMTSISPGLYDLNNVLTTVPNNKFTIQTITVFQTGLTRIQWGQTIYDDLQSAKNALLTRDFVVENNIKENGVTRAYIIVRNSTTSLQNVSDAYISEAQKFGGVASGGVALTLANIVTALGYTPENLANKQNSLAVDGTGIKYPTVDAINAVLPVSYSKIVYVNATSPTSATVFDLNNPPVTNDDLLKTDVNNLYIGTDASTWVYKTSPAGYVTKTVTSQTSNFNIVGTTIDAGNSKSAEVIRYGSITAPSFKRTGGLSTEYLKADGSSTVLTNPITGTGITNTIPLFTGTTTQGNSIIKQVSGSVDITNDGYFTPALIIRGTGLFYQSVDFFGGSSITNATKFQFGQYNSGQVFFFNVGNERISFFTNALERFTVGANGNSLFGTTTDNGQGVGQFNGNITFSNGTLPNHGVTKAQLDLKADISNAVLLTGDQTISGIKSFTGKSYFNNAVDELGNSIYVESNISNPPVLIQNLGTGAALRLQVPSGNQALKVSVSGADTMQIMGNGDINARLISPKTYTVATLPTPTTSTAYATVTDALAPSYLGTLTGGGTVKAPVFFDGTVWKSTIDATDVVRNIAKDATQGANVTGTVSETILYSKLIPANTFKDGDFMNLFSRVAKNGTAGNLQQRVKINTTNTLSGSITIARNDLSTTNLSGNLSRVFNITNGLIFGYPFTIPTSIDIANFNISHSTATFDPTVDNYIFITGILGNSADTMYHLGTKITN